MLRVLSPGVITAPDAPPAASPSTLSRVKLPAAWFPEWHGLHEVRNIVITGSAAGFVFGGVCAHAIDATASSPRARTVIGVLSQYSNQDHTLVWTRCE